MVSYAMFLIDCQIKYNKDTEADEEAQLLSFNDNVSIRLELETVLKNDSVKSKPSPTIQSPVIIEEVPESKNISRCGQNSTI